MRRAINHRGYNIIAPENTLAAFKLSKEHGFETVECDVTLSKDGVPVILHDHTLDRTSNGTGNVYDYTFEELRKLDFGSWFSDEFKGEKIPTFEEFCQVCVEKGYRAYVEIKNDAPMNQEEVNKVIGIADRYGLIDRITWISFKAEFLLYVRNTLPEARLGYLANPSKEGYYNLKTYDNEVFFDMKYTRVNDEYVRIAKECGAGIEVWTVNTKEDMESLDPYISGVTSNWLVADQTK